MLAAMPWDLAPDLPWRVFTSPAEQWHEQPSFVIGECLFIVCAVLAAVHARRCGRDHVLVWVAALVAGTANDLIFMALPLVDTFWQAQAMVMLTPRLPLYIPCVYVCFMYFPTVAVRRLGPEPWGAAALTGLVACLFYAPYDIVGAKFSWWTWHDTDGPIATRVLGAPVSSSLWVLTFVGSFSWLVGWALRKDPEATGRGFVRGLVAVAGFTTLAMMLQITVLQQLDGGAPAYRAFGAGLAVYGVVAWFGRGTPRASPRPAADRLLHRLAVAYFVTLVAIMAIFDPGTHVNTGVHQTVGPCYVETTDITGQTRHEYLCARDFDEDYTFDCVDAPPPDGARWYTVCGKPHTNFTAWMAGTAVLGLAGLIAFSLLLRGRSRPGARADRTSAGKAPVRG
jgi:hypothetical protein